MPTPLRAMSFNIRYAGAAGAAGAADAEQRWENRLPLVAGMLRFHRVDVAGLQEVERRQLDDLLDRLPAFAWSGVGRDDGVAAGEYCPVFFRKERFDLVNDGVFWLSPTPERPGPPGWDAALQRICSWAILRDRLDDTLFAFFNAHFDHVGEQARMQSARLLLTQIDAIAGDLPVIVAGDFNCIPFSIPYQILIGSARELALRDAQYASAYPHHGPPRTFHNFSGQADAKIDYLFVKNNVTVWQHGVLADHWGGRYPSDHFPVTADLLLTAAVER